MSTPDHLPPTRTTDSGIPVASDEHSLTVGPNGPTVLHDAHLAPNSYGGPKADGSKELPAWWVEAGEIGRYAYETHRDDDDFVQPRALYRDVMSPTDREHLVTNIVAHASDNVSAPVQERVVAYWSNVDADLGARVAAGLGQGAVAVAVPSRA